MKPHQMLAVLKNGKIFVFQSDVKLSNPITKIIMCMCVHAHTYKCVHTHTHTCVYEIICTYLLICIKPKRHLAKISQLSLKMIAVTIRIMNFSPG